nr:MAG TPA: hypothetical protein [Caudoviricetes sp.]
MTLKERESNLNDCFLFCFCCYKNIFIKER